MRGRTYIVYFIFEDDEDEEEEEEDTEDEDEDEDEEEDEDNRSTIFLQQQKRQTCDSDDNKQIKKSFFHGKCKKYKTIML
jgi:hypothetical protein